MQQGIADIAKIHEILEKKTANDISKGTGISLSSIKKLKSGERSVEKLNLKDAILLTNFAVGHTSAEIEIWQRKYIVE